MVSSSCSSLSLSPMAMGSGPPLSLPASDVSLSSASSMWTSLPLSHGGGGGGGEGRDDGAGGGGGALGGGLGGGLAFAACASQPTSWLGLIFRAPFLLSLCVGALVGKGVGRGNRDGRWVLGGRGGRGGRDVRFRLPLVGRTVGGVGAVGAVGGLRRRRARARRGAGVGGTNVPLIHFRCVSMPRTKRSASSPTFPLVFSPISLNLARRSLPLANQRFS